MPRTHAPRCKHLVACVACGDCPSYVEIGGGALVTLCGEHAYLLLTVRERGTDLPTAETRR